MSEEFSTLKADVEKLEAVAQSTADGLVAARADAADLRTQLANLATNNPDVIAMKDLAASVEAKLAKLANELPEPTPAPALAIDATPMAPTDVAPAMPTDAPSVPSTDTTPSA